MRNHSHYSLLASTSRSKQIVKTCKDSGFSYAGITDLATISGCVNFIQACKREGLKPIIGSEIYLENDARLTLICRNKAGWDQLLRVISVANDPKNYDRHPVIPFASLLENISPENFVCIDGYFGSLFFQSVFPDTTCIFDSVDEEDRVRQCLVDDAEQVALNYASEMMGVFPHYYMEVNETDYESFPVLRLLSSLIYGIDSAQAEQNGRSFLLPDTGSYYPERKDAVDHRVLVCTKLKTTMRQLPDKIEELKDLESLKFIMLGSYYIKSRSFLEENYHPSLVANLDEIAEGCEDIEILSKPKLPTFQTPDGDSENDYLKQLCRDGWMRLIAKKVDKSLHMEYRDRVLKELAVIEKANLAGYFLIVQDYVNHFRDKGCLIGPARGSGGGSLVCYLTGITLIDPIEYDLLFERFYNEGRNTDDHVSLPDIDVDFPPDYRDQVIDYLKETYGEHRVCQMLTFGRLAGRSIIKEVMRVNESCGFEQMNEITAKIPNEAAISDLLENMDEPSVIRWVLENDKDSLADYCWLNDDGQLEGEYARVFEQAMRMEGIFKTQGKHAAGVVIASDTLDQICPMVKASRSEEKIAGMEMGDLEAIGCVKFDILGVSLLQKISNTVGDINNRNAT